MVAEGVLGRALDVLAGPVEVEEHRPGMDGKTPFRCRPARLAEDVALCGERVDARLDPEPLVERGVGLEEELAAVEQVHLAAGLCGKTSRAAW